MYAVSDNTPLPACSSIAVDAMPRMPCWSACSDHRQKLAPPSLYPNACVARPVGKAELRTTPAAQAAMKAEWDRLRTKRVWDESVVREWDDVAREARQAGVEANLGYLFGICAEKNSEQPLGHPSRKLKGRVVFQGKSCQSGLATSHLRRSRERTGDHGCLPHSGLLRVRAGPRD